MNEIENVGDEEFYPIGAFVRKDLLWPVVQDFFVEPTTPSASMAWKDENEIDWPDW